MTTSMLSFTFFKATTSQLLSLTHKKSSDRYQVIPLNDKGMHLNNLPGIVNYYYYYHYYYYIHLTAFFPGQPGKVGTRKVNHSAFFWNKRRWDGSGNSWTILVIISITRYCDIDQGFVKRTISWRPYIVRYRARTHVLRVCCSHTEAESTASD